MDETISIDFLCVNCDQSFVVSEKASLYCSQHCQQVARLVRYMRACFKDGRIEDPLVREAIQVQLAFVCSEKGYYDKKARQIPLIVRRKVIERDKGLCRKCGAAGVDIDHI